jgi:hypothetical protein
MESDMVDKILHPEKIIEKIKNHFSINLPNFKMTSESCSPPYWEITLEENNIMIQFSGDLGIESKVVIDNSKYNLWEYDKSLANQNRSSEENIDKHLIAFQKFLKSN